MSLLLLYNQPSGGGPTGTTVKVWSGAAWVPIVLKKWNGSAWVPVFLKRWNGSAWVTT